MHSFKELQQIVNEQIKKYNFDYQPYELYEPIKYIMTLGGKRIRPVITILSCEMFGGQIDKALMPAIGMEMFHNFTLVHDDIMDNAEYRRSSPTVHTKWDENRAILSGDAMLLMANRLMLQTDDDILREVMDLYTSYGLKVCDGQQYDMNYETQKDIKLADYIKMIELKTAALIAGCFKLGAVLAKTTESNKQLIESFGHNLGISFQIEDDILDSFGDFNKFGKKIGGDIRENKKTFLILKALEIADEKTREKLIQLYSKSDNTDDEKVDQVIEIFNKLNINEFAQKESKSYYDKAMGFLDQINIPDPKKSKVIELTHYLFQRDF